MQIWLIILLVVLALVIAAVAFAAGVAFRKRVGEREIGSAEEEAKRILNEAIKSAESKKREALLEAKEEIHKSRAEYEREVKERRAELSKQEHRLQQKEEHLDKKTDAIDRKNELLTKKISEVEAQQEEVLRLKNSQLEVLERISGYSAEEAKALLIDSLASEVTHEQAMKLREIEQQYKDEAEERAKRGLPPVADDAGAVRNPG